MNEDVFNGSIRKFLKTLGVGAQHEMEKAVRQAIADGKLRSRHAGGRWLVKLEWDAYDANLAA